MPGRTKPTARSENVPSKNPVVVMKDSTPKQDETIPGRSCKTCGGADTDMVQCDQCNKWHHFACVDVTADIEHQSWVCPNCVATKGLQQQSSNPAKNSTLAKSEAGCSKQKPAITPNQLFTAVPSLKQTDEILPFKTMSLKEAKASKQYSRKAVSEQPRRVSPAAAHASTNNDLVKLELLKLEEERALDQMETSKRRSYVDKKYNLLRQMTQPFEGSHHGGMSCVGSWVCDVNRVQQEGAMSNVFNPQQHSTCNQSQVVNENNENRSIRLTRETLRSRECLSQNEERIDSRPMDQYRRSSVIQTDHPSHLDPIADIPPHHSHVINPSEDRHAPVNFDSMPSHPTVVNHLEGRRVPVNLGPSASLTPIVQTREVLSKEHLAARQAIPRDLPLFSGCPDDWPIFLSTFNSTTEMYGFTHAENVFRLQKCLKGRAYEAVKSRLMHPSNVPGIIATLKMLFGQPEAIIHSLMAKINALPSLREDKLETIVDFAVSVQNFCATVDACGLEDHLYNVALLQQLVGKLPPSIKLDWAYYRQSISRVNLATFGNWLYSLAEAASTVTTPISFEPNKIRKESHGFRKGNVFLNAHTESPDGPSTAISSYHSSVKMPYVPINECPVCKGGCKTADRCKRFQELSRDARWAAVREFHLCRKCLRQHNGKCKSKPCGRNGCTLLHHEMQVQQATPSQSATAIQQPGTSQSYGCNTHRSMPGDALFRYIPVILRGPSRTLKTFAFFDDGPELTLLDQELADALQLGGEVSPLSLRWTGGNERFEGTSQIVSLGITGIQKGNEEFRLHKVRTVKELLLPCQSLKMNELADLYPHLRRLPVDSYQNAQPRLLIGVKHAHLGLILKYKEGLMNEPVAAKTRLGWTVFGGSSNESQNVVQCAFHSPGSDEDLHVAMKNFFALEGLGIVKPDNIPLSSEERRTQTLLKTLIKLKNGRYESGLLWRYDDIRLPDSREMALRRFYSMEKRMQKDSVLAETLNCKINEYLQKGYIRKILPQELSRTFSRVWYLPFFPVTNPNKPEKIRIVWDAAASAYGKSLNSALLKGPDQLCSLYSILLQFRENRIGLTGDIREISTKWKLWKPTSNASDFLAQSRRRYRDVRNEGYDLRSMLFTELCAVRLKRQCRTICQAVSSRCGRNH
ncbi:uncharacterized protein LOC129779750 [Toxorhynchites rutilus septentrionalis]|uniref:uncharacterized protein LOC129779750 n=1 Tax=Toxorhynchites rutilus septentrionalis TaxID=329112 RepID=UPI0024784A56|nr:uncharacterized protein LOC129779750 [Toxorhynchites rutilus septentrionalis]